MLLALYGPHNMGVPAGGHDGDGGHHWHHPSAAAAQLKTTARPARRSDAARVGSLRHHFTTRCFQKSASAMAVPSDRRRAGTSPREIGAGAGAGHRSTRARQKRQVRERAVKAGAAGKIYNEAG